MRPDDIRAVLQRQPFRAFRLYVLETTAYEVRHPDLVLVGPSVLDIHVPDAGGPIPLSARQVLISLLHVSRVEFLPAAPSGNGE